MDMDYRRTTDGPGGVVLTMTIIAGNKGLQTDLETGGVEVLERDEFGARPEARLGEVGALVDQIARDVVGEGAAAVQVEGHDRALECPLLQRREGLWGQ